MVISDEDREWIDTRADQLFRESERRRGGIRPNTVMPQDFRDYFVVQAAWERAEKRGAERMRERATQAAEPKRKPKKKNGGLHRGAYTDPQAAGAYSARQSIAKAIRALPHLAEALAATPKRGLTIVAHDDGSPVPYNTAQKWMRAARVKVGAERWDQHALRYSAVDELSEAGCTDEQIMSVTGHSTLDMVRLYAGRARQRRHAAQVKELRE